MRNHRCFACSFQISPDFFFHVDVGYVTTVYFLHSLWWLLTWPMKFVRHLERNLDWFGWCYRMAQFSYVFFVIEHLIFIQKKKYEFFYLRLIPLLNPEIAIIRKKIIILKLWKLRSFANNALNRMWKLNANFVGIFSGKIGYYQ